jgi:hypothetical protein
MNKKVVISISAIVVIIGIISIWSYTLQNNRCYDCGAGGWLIQYQCGKINNIEEAFDCLSTHASGDLNFPKPDNVDNLTELYIKEKTLERNNKPFPDSVFVYSFHGMAVDQQGNVYVEAYLG